MGVSKMPDKSGEQGLHLFARKAIFRREEVVFHKK